MGEVYAKKDSAPFDAGLFSPEVEALIKSLKSIDGLDVSPCLNAYANEFVKAHHYLKRKLYIAKNLSYSLSVQGHIVGVAMFGYPVWHKYPKLVPPYKNGEVVELLRLCTLNGLPKNTESWFLSRCFKAVRQDWINLTHITPCFISSFCDTAFGFDGALYKALNFHSFRATTGRATNPGETHGKWKKNTHEQKAEKIFYLLPIGKKNRKFLI